MARSLGGSLLYDYAVVVDLAVEQFGPCRGEGIAYLCAPQGIDHKQYAAATTSAADLPGNSTRRRRLGDERFNRWRRHPRGQGLPHSSFSVYLFS